MWPQVEADSLPVVLTNRGLVFPTGSEPEAPFSLRCNEAYQVTTAALPNLVLDTAGSLVLQTTRGVSITHDSGCGFEAASGLPDEVPLGAFAVDPTSAGKLLVSTQDYQSESGVYASDDFGHTWSLRAKNAASSVYDKLVFGGDGQRVYAAGARYDLVSRKLVPIWAVSQDGGRTFRDQDLAKVAHIPVGVHPKQVDTVFAREIESTGISAPHDRVVRSRDGGSTWQTVLTLDSGVTTFTASPDGGRIWIGTDTTGLYVSENGGDSFTRVDADDILSVRCLYHRAGVLWVCANRYPNTHGIWTSADDGKSWHETLTFARVTSQISCANQTKNVCEQPWADWERELLNEPKNVSDAGVGSGPAVVTGDAGTTTTGSARTDAGKADEGDADESLASDSDGGCNVAKVNTATETLCWLLALSLLTQRRRKLAS